MFPIEQLHPLIVHFPIVFMLSLAAFDAIVVFRGATIGGRGGVATVSAGLAVCAGIGGILAFVFGDLALDVAVDAGTPLSLMENHEDLGKITAGVMLAWAIVRSDLWWRNKSLTGRGAKFIVFVELGMAALIITTAFFGGQLVYEFGVGVVRSGG